MLIDKKTIVSIDLNIVAIPVINYLILFDCNAYVFLNQKFIFSWDSNGTISIL